MPRSAKEKEVESVLVTGASGFIGMHVCRALAEGGATVLALVRPGSDWSRLRSVPNLRIVYGSVRSREWLEQVTGVGCVIHLAADWGRLNPDDDIAFARALRGVGVERMVFVSSICAAGLDHCPHPIPEDADARFRPDDFYGRYKNDAERGLERVAAETGLHLAILRPTIVYGEGDRGNLVPLVDAIRRERLALWGHGENQMRLCSAANLARACVEAALQGMADDRIVNVGDSECLSLREVCRRIAAALGVPFRYRNHGMFLARPLGWLRFVANRLQLSDSFGTHFAHDKWTRAFDAEIANLTVLLPDGAGPNPFDAAAAVSAAPSAGPSPQAVGMPVRVVRAAGILFGMLGFRARRWLARRRRPC